uniref:Uncharacterized protein n=1 Tax=Rangifer tarandus platyrhynchus TaxID=3082113 RepID=A0ACB0ED71_RANTA|nr:unnamed protein product [Rangifer tarandus platyrhynchus]
MRKRGSRGSLARGIVRALSLHATPAEPACPSAGAAQQEKPQEKPGHRSRRAAGLLKPEAACAQQRRPAQPKLNKRADKLLLLSPDNVICKNLYF